MPIVTTLHTVLADPTSQQRGVLGQIIQPILRPLFPWEFVQIGNCGSPIELDEGWLLLTHGVGPVRRYSIGAVLLDKADPSRVLARSKEPLVRPDPSEREGYVPNVVYTCGALSVQGGRQTLWLHPRVRLLAVFTAALAVGR